MGSLTPEERRKIYEEEKARIEAEERQRAQMMGPEASTEPARLMKTQNDAAEQKVRKLRFNAAKISPNSWLVLLGIVISLLLFVILPGANYLAGVFRAFPDSAPHQATSSRPSPALSRDQYQRMTAHYAAGKYADAIDDFRNFDEKSPFYPKAVAIRNKAEEHIVPLFAKVVAAGKLDQANALLGYVDRENLSNASRATFIKALTRYQAMQDAADKARKKAEQAAEAQAAAAAAANSPDAIAGRATTQLIQRLGSNPHIVKSGIVWAGSGYVAVVNVDEETTAEYLNSSIDYRRHFENTIREAARTLLIDAGASDPIVVVQVGDSSGHRIGGS